MDESVIPMFFLLRQAIGRRTYIRQIRRLFAGELLTWRNGKQRVRIVRSLSSDPDYHTIGQATPEAITRLYENMKAVMGSYHGRFCTLEPNHRKFAVGGCGLLHSANSLEPVE